MFASLQVNESCVFAFGFCPALDKCHLSTGKIPRKDMRDPFDAPVDLINVDHNGGNQLSRISVVPARDHGLQNGDAKSFAPNSDTLIRSFLLEQK